MFLLSIPVCGFIFWQLNLSVHQYTFRIWESIITQSRLMGPFYPDMKLKMSEVGDLVPYSSQAILKNVEWTTDDEGYRNSVQCSNPQVVVLGDSMAVGTGLTEKDTFASQLALTMHQCVRSFAGGNLGQSAKRMSALGLKPKVIVLVMSEKVPASVRELELGSDRSLHGFERERVSWVHFRKNLYWNFRNSHGVVGAILRSFMNDESIERQIAPGAETHKEMQFSHEQGGSEGLSEFDLQLMVAQLNQFSDQLSKVGARLIFTIVPNKESIYYRAERLQKPVFNDRFKTHLGSAKFQYVDLISIFQNAHEKTGEIYHQLDDTHWNSDGVSLLVKNLNLSE